jgi:hypothetical protein
MATIRKWSNVIMSMQSALAAADTITGITKANPAVVTSTAHGMSNGAYVFLQVQGMHQLNDRVVRIANVAANTFELEGIDSTSFDTFSSGSAQEITWGTSISTCKSISSNDPGADMLDATTVHDNTKVEIPGLQGAMTYNMEHLWDPADAGQIAMKAASDAQAKRAFKMQFGSGGAITVFAGYVSFSGQPGGNAQDIVTTGGTITGRAPTHYSS